MNRGHRRILPASLIAKIFLIAAIVLAAPVPGASLIIYDEAVNGDLTNLERPIQLPLAPGSNEIVGSVQDPIDLFDPFSFLVSPGQQVNQIIFLELERAVAFTLFAGPAALVPFDIGSAVVLPFDAGKDLLPSMGLSPLASGTYSARVFAGFGPESPYRLDLRVAPEPSVLLLFASGIAALAGFARRLRLKK